MIHTAAEMLKKEQRGLACRIVAPAAIGKFIPVDFHEASGGGEVGVGHIEVFQVVVVAIYASEPRAQARARMRRVRNVPQPLFITDFENAHSPLSLGRGSPPLAIRLSCSVYQKISMTPI